MSDLFRLEAVEVVRRGRFSWDVVSRYPGGLDTCLNQPYLFRRSAVRHAKREIEKAGVAEQVIARFEPKRRGAIAQDFGAQSFGPATGSDGDTRDWCDDEAADGMT